MPKIRSHPGVRSDLFKRPLDKTLITDFFGGVAQAEVIFPEDSDLPAPRPDSTVDDIRQVQLETQGRPSVLPSPSQPRWWEEGGDLRAWGSVVILGSLVGWVGSRK